MVSFLLAAGFLAALGWFFGGDHSSAQQSKRRSVEREGAAVSVENATTPSDTQSQTAEATSADQPGERRSERHVVRAAPLKIPGISSPEAERVVADLQNAYRDSHVNRQAAAEAFRSQLARGSVQDSGSLSSSFQQAIGTLPDAAYGTAALPQVTNPGTPRALMSVLYADLATRPDPIKLRTLFLIAGIDSHPLAATALEDLQSNLNTDFQKDWSRWDQAISQQLAHEQRGVRSDDCRVH